MSYNPFNLHGKTVLVTGASSGIGKAAAIECSRAGATVIITARNESRLREVHSMLERPESQPPFIVADMRSDRDVDLLVSSCPRLDGAFINAGISINVPVQFINREKLLDIFEVNTFAPILLTRSLIKSKRLNKGSSLVYTASVSGNNTVTVAHEMYSATKTAITGFMRNVALDLAHKKIRANAVNPGMINTPMVHGGKYSEEQLQRDMENYPLGRFGNPEEVAYAVVYLLSDAAAWVTGQSLVIDGGLTLK
ncbi:MAG: SDR family oxidoreductase [Bacteroides sp.]|nr:SDR family oxidoreductase [Bacteroides sp.]